MTDQAILAVRLAAATVTTRAGFRAHMVAMRGSTAFGVVRARRSSDVIPRTSRRRRYRSPMRDGAPANTLLNKLYLDDDRATRLFAIGAGLAVLIGCIGLWGLASFNTQRRVKEIGIRKTLGASSGEIVRLLVGQFLRPVLIANLIVWPLAFAAMRNWLAGFDDRISLSPLYFIGASFLAIAIAVLTVVGQSYRASRATPALAMRHE